MKRRMFSALMAAGPVSYTHLMSTAINIFLKKVARERRIPFELTADPFYSESNMHYLEKKMEDYKAGRLNLVEHELIEE